MTARSPLAGFEVLKDPVFFLFLLLHTLAPPLHFWWVLELIVEIAVQIRMVSAPLPPAPRKHAALPAFHGIYHGAPQHNSQLIRKYFSARDNKKQHNV